MFRSVTVVPWYNRLDECEAFGRLVTLRASHHRGVCLPCRRDRSVHFGVVRFASDSSRIAINRISAGVTIWSRNLRESRPRSALFDTVVAAIQRLGPVIVLPEKTRIAFQTRMSFAQVTPRRNWLDGHVVLARRLEHPRFRKIETISPRNHVHHFRLVAIPEIDAEFEEFLREAYAVGEQRHLTNRDRP